MTYPNLAESERLGIISLCNDLKQQGALHSTIEHIRELLTSRVSRLNDLAALVRELEQPAPVSATEPEFPASFVFAPDSAEPKMLPAVEWLREEAHAWSAFKSDESDEPNTAHTLNGIADYIDTLRARVAELETDVLAQNDMLKDLGESRQAALDRVAELERVTEEQVERACVAFYGERGWKTAPARMANESRAFMRAALTAARGGG